jgi:hypothetical protein
MPMPTVGIVRDRIELTKDHFPQPGLEGVMKGDGPKRTERGRPPLAALASWTSMARGPITTHFQSQPGLERLPFADRF